MAVAAAMPVVATVAQAGDSGYGPSGVSSLAQREMIRRQRAVTDGDKLLAEGREAYAKGDYQTAVDKYRQALERLPDAPMLQDRRDSYTKHLVDASVALAQQFRKVGKYPEARTLLDNVLDPKIDPNNLDAKRELEWLDDPIRTNPALTYEHTQNVDKVRKALYMAEGYYNLGKFDDAKREYSNAIRIDPYNKAARRGMERVSAAKTDYYRAAYDETRATLLGQVDAAWELSVPAELAPAGPGQDLVTNQNGSSYILEKLRTIIIPVINFEDTTVEEAIDFLRQRTTEIDTTEVDPTKKGINFVIRKPKPGGAAPASAEAPVEATPAPVLAPAAEPGSLRIRELRLRNVPVAVVLKYICDSTKLRYKVDDYAVTLVPGTEPGEDLVNRNFRVPPDFISNLENAGNGGGGAAPAAEADPFAAGAAATPAGGGGARTIKPHAAIQELLKNNGVPFPEGASANVFSSGTLVVRNTPTNLDLVESIVEAMQNTQPKQIKILTKFVEISQENSEELGFDWIVTPFGLNTNGNVNVGGGTVGSGQSRTNADFISPVNGTSIPGIPSATATNVTNILTGGNRSGAGAISQNSIDALLKNPNQTAQTTNAAPGIMSLTGLFSEGQVQMIMRGLSQKKGADVMTAPSVTAKSGQKATIEVIREFIYPTEYEPPQLPNSVGGGITTSLTGLGGGSSGGGFPVTPATPTAFETKNTGVTLEIEPTLGNNDFVIDLRFAPEIVEFEGFVNYGSPIQSSATDFLGNPTTVTITENRIEMPVFSARRVNTSLTIYDGYTVAVGGLMKENVQNVEDKVPILGDIPIIGRLFQTKAENRIKSNLIIFVTAQIIDATGRPLRGAEAAGASPNAPSRAAGVSGTAIPDAGVLPPIH
jgi:general secretion pathway protein D